VSLYNLPDRTAQVVSTVPAGTAVVVDARNSDGTWLRARLGGVRSWGEASAFTCADTFRITDLQPDPTVRQASATPASAATSAATSAPVIVPSITPPATASPGG
jgi:hypothetical protein